MRCTRACTPGCAAHEPSPLPIAAGISLAPVPRPARRGLAGPSSSEGEDGSESEAEEGESDAELRELERVDAEEEARAERLLGVGAMAVNPAEQVGGLRRGARRVLEGGPEKKGPCALAQRALRLGSGREPAEPMRPLGRKPPRALDPGLADPAGGRRHATTRLRGLGLGPRAGGGHHGGAAQLCARGRRGASSRGLPLRLRPAAHGRGGRGRASGHLGRRGRRRGSRGGQRRRRQAGAGAARWAGGGWGPVLVEGGKWI